MDLDTPDAAVEAHSASYAFTHALRLEKLTSCNPAKCFLIIWRSLLPKACLQTAWQMESFWEELKRVLDRFRLPGINPRCSTSEHTKNLDLLKPGNLRKNFYARRHQYHVWEIITIFSRSQSGISSDPEYRAHVVIGLVLPIARIFLSTTDWMENQMSECLGHGLASRFLMRYIKCQDRTESDPS
jgi:hypothetical protein